MNIFVTGTDTDVGKTVVSAWICKQLNARYWKPLQTGCAEDSDKRTVKTLSPQTELVNEIYRLKAPLSPYDAAQLEGLEIDINKILEAVPDKSVIEGAGGLLVPICENFRMIDLAEKANSKVLIVVRAKLGFLNHIFLTTECLKSRNIPTIGIVLIGNTEDFLIKTIEKFSQMQVLKVLPIASNISKMIEETPVPEEIRRTLQ